MEKVHAGTRIDVRANVHEPRQNRRFYKKLVKTASEVSFSPISMINFPCWIYGKSSCWDQNRGPSQRSWASAKSTILSKISQNGLRGVIFTNFIDKFPMFNLWEKFMLGPESRSKPAFMSLGEIDDFIEKSLKRPQRCHFHQLQW